jgi:plasmid stabilization system protein ParE
LPRIEFTRVALAQLDRMIDTYELPGDTRGRVARSIRHLGEFPDSGSPLEGEWEGFRFVLGPWSWMLIVYSHLDDLVAIVTIEDARADGAATGRR